MPAGQTLKDARRRLGPSVAYGGDSLAWRSRLEESAAGLAAPLLIGGLALAGGGFATDERHVAGLAVWLFVALMLALGAAGWATLARPFYWAAGLIGAFALWSALSCLWSGSVELSVIETDRVLVYLGVFVAAVLVTQTSQARQRFGEGLALTLIGIALLALCSRLLPHILSVSENPETGARLSYPLGYWNGDGVTFGIAAGLALWLSRRSLNASLRWLAAASLPAILLALYFTYSRGGLLALVITAGCVIALSHDRLWLLATLAIGAITAAPAVLAVQARESLAQNVHDSAIAGQGAVVLLILAAGTALAVALFAGLRALERRPDGLTGRALALSRDPKALRWIGLALAVVAIGGAVAVGSRAANQFSKSDLQPPTNPQEHLTALSGGERSEFWRVAVDAFREKPLLGHGAGTYRLSWHQLRHNAVPNLDAHSLYLQAFAELGVLGGLLILAVVGTLLWTGIAAWRAADGGQRDLYAALLGVSFAFAICAGIDWFWQIAAMGAIFFLASGALVAARCAQLERWREPRDGSEGGRRYGLAIVGLVTAWIAALALVGPLLVEYELNASNSAAAEGNLASAVSRAETARSIEPWATSPYKQLGLLAEREGNYPRAVEQLDKAIDREKDSWLLYYLRARVQHKAGNEAAARADQREARRLNPEEECLFQGYEGCG